MNQKLKFFLISFLYFPIAVLGEMLGKLFHSVYTFMIGFTFIQLPKWAIDFGTIVVPDLLAGWIAAIIFSKLTKKTYSTVLLIVPIAFMLFVLLGTLILSNYRQFAQITILFISFVYFLKKECPNKLIK